MRSKGSWFAGRAKSTTAIAIAIVALLSLGTAVAGKKLITGKDVKNNSVPGKKIRKHTITGKQIKKHSIPLSALKRVPAAPKGAEGRARATGRPRPARTHRHRRPARADGVHAKSCRSAARNRERSRRRGTRLPRRTRGNDVFLDGDRGFVTATATIGRTRRRRSTTRKNFRVGICFRSKEKEIEPFYAI